MNEVQNVYHKIFQHIVMYMPNLNLMCEILNPIL
jgi:hypothetical protein